VSDTPEAACAAADNLITHADPSVAQQRQAVMAGTPVDDSAQLGRDQHRLEPASLEDFYCAGK
jgi:hypothetical protein